MVRFVWLANWLRSILTFITTRTSIPTMPIGKLIITALQMKSGNRREGRITHFVSMLGTSGTFMGATRRLKELNPRIRCISLQPDSAFHGIEGTKYMASAIVPKIYDPSLADADLGISTEDAYAMAKRLAREEGLLVGISAAAAVAGCLQLARRVAEK